MVMVQLLFYRFQEKMQEFLKILVDLNSLPQVTGHRQSSVLLFNVSIAEEETLNVSWQCWLDLILQQHQPAICNRCFLPDNNKTFVVVQETRSIHGHVAVGRWDVILQPHIQVRPEESNVFIFVRQAWAGFQFTGIPRFEKLTVSKPLIFPVTPFLQHEPTLLHANCRKHCTFCFCRQLRALQNEEAFPLSQQQQHASMFIISQTSLFVMENVM